MPNEHPPDLSLFLDILHTLEAMVFHYLDVDPDQSAVFDETYVDARAEALGADVVTLWGTIKDVARREAN